MINHKAEEILEEIWVLNEKGENRLDILREMSQIKEHFQETLNTLVEKNLVEIKNLSVFLTKAGEKISKQIIRRHRLAEVLLSEVFDLSEADIEATACSFEHILNPNVTESICTFLGHPRECFHGKKIPRGKCCENFQIEVKPMVIPLSKLEVGQEGTIFFMTPDSHHKLDKLSSLGLIPGKKIRLHQKKPSFVIQIDETSLALDKVITDEIFVKPLANPIEND